MDLFKQYLQYQKEVSQATLKVIERFQQQVPHQPQSSGSPTYELCCASWLTG